MAVITIFDIVARPFSGYQDPRLPSGFWKAGGASTGDATGGDHTIQISFNRSTALFNSQFYSLEQYMIASGNALNTALRLAIANFDLVAGLTNISYTLSMVQNEAAQTSLTPEQTEGLRGLFLGQQTTPDASQAISITIDNTNLEVFSALLQGYIWGVRSMSVEGGAQRPANGLYRS